MHSLSIGERIFLRVAFVFDIVAFQVIWVYPLVPFVTQFTKQNYYIQIFTLCNGLKYSLELFLFRAQE